MRKRKKLLVYAMSFAVAVSAVLPTQVRAEQIKIEPAAEADAGEKPAKAITLKVGGTATPSYKYGQKKQLTLEVVNNTQGELQNVVVKPQVKANIDKWPFEIENTSYEQKIEKIAAGATEKVTYDLKARENVESKYYNLKLDVNYDGGKNSEQNIFVKMTAKPEEKAADSQKQESQAEAEPVAEAVEFSNSEPVMSGGDSESGSGSVPRVIVTGFSTNPSEVKAGSNFKLIVHLKNTSKSTAVKNMLFDFNAPTEGEDANTTAPAFLPVSGSSTVYMEKIGANGTKDVSIDLNAKSDLVQKPYSVEMAVKYENSSAEQFESTSSISIPVKQDARFEFSEFELSSENLEVGGEMNVMCNLYNLGRIKLYNLKAKFEGEGISSKEIFVGNVEPGATATIDGMITGESETTGDGKVKMIVTYEDEAGTLTTTEKELTVFVTEAMEDDAEAVSEEMPEEGKSFPVIPVVIGCIVVAVIAAVVVFKKKKRKNMLQNEEEILIDELDRLTEDE